MAKKEKLNIQKDKRMEPIDNELDAALGLLENANRQITDLLASFVPIEPGASEYDKEESVVPEGVEPAAKVEAIEAESTPEEP